jgi:hypothetical protein
VGQEGVEDLMKAVKRMFVYQFTKKKSVDITKYNSELLQKAHTPLGVLKLAVSRQMKELAEISCDKTIKLMDKWFGAHQTQMIMQDLSAFPPI